MEDDQELNDIIIGQSCSVAVLAFALCIRIFESVFLCYLTDP